MRFCIADDVLDYKDACLMKDSSENPNTFIIFRLTVVVNNKKNIVNRVINLYPLGTSISATSQAFLF